jgi:DNA-binding transcriptional LysR family regulator
MAFTLRQLQFFIAAAEAGSVTGAARALSISQSSVTEAIRALEDDLGVPLFDRQARGLEITHKGSAFLRHARQILADVATARAAFRDETETHPRPAVAGASPAWLRAMCCPTSCRAFAAPTRRSS